MKLNKMIAFFVTVSLAVLAKAVVIVDIPHDTSGCRPGYWTSDFAAAKAMADAKHIPLLSFWGYENCAHCAKTKSNGLVSDLFKGWVAKKPIILVYTEVTDATRYDKTAVKEFTRGDNSSGDYPFMRCYWKKADGSTVSKCFSGNKGQFPYSQGVIAEQLVGTLDMYFGSWSPVPDYAGGYFSVTNRPKARLEAVAGTTKYVDIPMYRTQKSVATNKIQIAGGSMANVIWPANTLKTSYRYTLPATAKAGSSIALKLYADDGKTVKSSSAINVVNDPGNHISNPKFIGESFGIGEWTMDLDAALSKAKSTATAKCYTLAVVGGDMWCPHCQNLRTNLLEKSEFKKWAQDHNVNLVCIDMPQKDKTTATLLTRDESSAGASGAAYLSRKMITDAKAQEIFNRNKTLSGSTWLPKSSTATRLSNPTILLINSDKTVAGRYYNPRQSNGGYPIQESIDRLNELLKLEGGDDLNTDPATTSETLAIEEGGDGEIQVNENVKYYKLTNVPAGKVRFTSSSQGQSLKLTVCEYTSAGGVTELASGSQTVTATFTTTANKYLKVSGFLESTAAYGTDTELSFGLESAVVLVPAQKSATYKAKSSTVPMEIVSGTKYKLSGFSSYPSLKSLGGGIYQATASATVMMGCSVGSTVTYQKWTPGTVQFTSASAKVQESVAKGSVTVTRTSGSSGAAKVKVSINGGSQSTKRVTVSPSVLSWADGESASKTVSYKINVDTAFHPDEQFVISLAADTSSSASVGSPAKFTLTVSDTSDPVFGKTSYSLRAINKMQYSQSFPINNILENGPVNLTIGGKLPRGVTAKYDSASKSVVIAGKPTAAGKSSFTIAVSETRKDGKKTGKTSTFSFESIAASDIKSSDSLYNAVVVGGGAASHVVPLYGKRGGKVVLAGSLEVKITKTYRITAKYVGTDGKATFSGALTSVGENGVISGALSKMGQNLTYKISKNGLMTATLTGVANDFGRSLSSDPDGATLVSADYSAYAGYYTVTLPTDVSLLKKGGETASTGTGYIVLKMDRTVFTSKGKVSYSGVMPDGTSFTGTSYLVPGQYTDSAGVRWGALPVIVRKASGSQLSVSLCIRRGAASAYKDDPQVVIEEPDASACCRSAGVYHELDVYGGIYVKGMDVESCCREYYETESFRFSCDTTYFAPSAKYGKITAASSGHASFTSSGKIVVENDNPSLPLTLRLNRVTGIVTGTAKAQFASGAPVKLTVRGVVLPGWVDCGCGDTAPVVRPIVSATAYFKDSQGRSRIARGFSLDLTESK